MTTTAAPRPPAPDASRAWTRDDVAAYLQAGTTSVDAIRAQDPSFPQPVEILSLIRWRAHEVIAWFNGADPAATGQPAKSAGTVAPIAVPAAVPAREAARRG